LFRSAAYTYGSRVIGVVLTGYLDDGTSGLWSVRRMGGLAIIQDPRDAEHPAMPTNALGFVEADHLVLLAQLGTLLVRLTLEPAPAKVHLPATQLDLLQIELTIAKQGGGFELGIIEKGELTPFTCPDCHGALTQLIEGKLLRYRCHTGHAYTVSALLSEVTQSVESMLYQSMRGLEETKMLLHNIGMRFVENGQPLVANLFFEKADETGQQARVVHASILQQEALSGDLQFYHKKKEED
jgi:two-component system chemotaxis response regulator CheB